MSAAKTKIAEPKASNATNDRHRIFVEGLFARRLTSESLREYPPPFLIIPFLSVVFTAISSSCCFLGGRRHPLEFRNDAVVYWVSIARIALCDPCACLAIGLCFAKRRLNARRIQTPDHCGERVIIPLLLFYTQKIGFETYFRSFFVFGAKKGRKGVNSIPYNA
jgi:hypothetical protein